MSFVADLEAHLGLSLITDPDITATYSKDQAPFAPSGSDSNRREFFGVDPKGDEPREPSGSAVDASICPRCDERLEWDFWRFNHIGRVHCSACGFNSPSADTRVSLVDAATGLSALTINSETVNIRVVNDTIMLPVCVCMKRAHAMQARDAPSGYIAI